MSDRAESVVLFLLGLMGLLACVAGFLILVSGCATVVSPCQKAFQNKSPKVCRCQDLGGGKVLIEFCEPKAREL